MCAACESVVPWDWLDENPAVANWLLAAERRRDPEGFAEFCAGVVLAKIGALGHPGRTTGGRAASETRKTQRPAGRPPIPLNANPESSPVRSPAEDVLIPRYRASRVRDIQGTPRKENP